MEATIVLDSVKHYPVLLKEIISVITPQHGGTFIDCTFGQGGYTKEILKFKDTKVISLDRDNFNLTSGITSYENLSVTKISDRYQYILPYYDFSSSLFRVLFNISSIFS